MHATATTKTVEVITTQEKKFVNLELTHDEAALLFCLMGQMEKATAKELIEVSIQRYNSRYKPLLNNLKDNASKLVSDLYHTLERAL